MKTTLLFGLGILATHVFIGCAQFATRGHPEEASSENKLPPLPPGITELKFSEFFVTPVGPRGLVPTEKLTSLSGARVRMLGYMVHHENALPGQFLFSALPLQLHEHDSSDDLPAAIVHVSVPTCLDQPVPFAPGLMLLTGTLNVGPREEADGRLSFVRLALDPPARRDRNTSFVSSKGSVHASPQRSPAR